MFELRSAFTVDPATCQFAPFQIPKPMPSAPIPRLQRPHQRRPRAPRNLSPRRSQQRPRPRNHGLPQIPRARHSRRAKVVQRSRSARLKKLSRPLLLRRHDHAKRREKPGRHHRIQPSHRHQTQSVLRPRLRYPRHVLRHAQRKTRRSPHPQRPGRRARSHQPPLPPQHRQRPHPGATVPRRNQRPQARRKDHQKSIRR